MNLFVNSSAHHVFERIMNASPRNLGECIGLCHETLAELEKDYGIIQAGCTIKLPADAPRTDKIPEDIVLFQAREPVSAEAEPLHYQYPFMEGGIDFAVILEDPERLSADERWVLEVIVRQFYYLFSSVVLSTAVQQLMNIDNATGIPNLKAFFQFVGKTLAQGREDQYTALFFNIHNFKSVHKSLTYLEGNEVMETYSRLVSQAVTQDEIVARLGGDNFVALIYSSNTDYFLDLIENIIITYEKNGKQLQFYFGATLGASRIVGVKHPGEVMMRISSAYQSAREMHALVCFYDQSSGNEIMERTTILSRFAGAIKDREFYAVYQPKVDVKSRTLLGAEALVRWRTADGCNMPMSFVPILEKDGCITSLDFYMLEEVCRFLRRLESEGIDMVKISVNFSKRHLTNNKLVEEIVEVIDRYRIPRKYIEIELTESEDANNSNVMREVVDELNLQGIRTSIDDFGTGYSSLSMLNTLQIKELKIDRSFLPQNKDGETQDERKTRMFKGVVNLAKSLGLTIVAEGVETPDQLELVESLDCDIIQGYIFDKPLEENEFIERIKRRIYALNGE